MSTREWIHDSPPRRSSRTSDRDGNDSSMIFNRRDITTRSDRSPVQINVDSLGFENRKQDVDKFRRDFGFSDPYEEEMQRDNGFSNNNQREEERNDERNMKHIHQSARLVDGSSDETKSSRFIALRDYSESCRHSEDGRDRETYIQESSPLSQVGSSFADFKDESSRLVSLYSRCFVRVNDSDRVDEKGRQEDYSENLCASQVLETRYIDDYVGRRSLRRYQQGESFGDLSYSPAVSRCGKEIVDESRKSFQVGSDIVVKEFPSVRHDVKRRKTMDRETDLLMQARGSLSKSYVRGLNVADVDAGDSNQYDFTKEHYPFVDLGSRVMNEQDDKDHNYMNFPGKERKVFYVDNKCHQYDGVDSRKYLDFSGPVSVVDRDEKAPQSMPLYLNKDRESYLDYERKSVYSDVKRQELRNEDHFGSDGRMNSDLDRADIVVDQDGRVMQLQRVCLDKGKAAYLDNERKDVYLNYKSQQLEKEYDSCTDARIYPAVNRSASLVDREDARGLRYRGVSLNDREETYLQCESQKLLKDHETNSYGMMHTNVNQSDVLDDARGLRYRGVSINDRKEAYLQYENQKLLNDYDTNSHVIMHPDVNKSDILVNEEDARGLRYRGVSLNDRKESYFQCQSQQLQNDHKTNPYGMMHPNLNKSDILEDQEDTRALELRRVSYDDGKESYNNERGEAYLRYESQQLKKDYHYGVDDMIYRDVSRSDIIVGHGNAKALEELRRVSFSDRNEAYLDNESKDAYQYYKIQQLKDYDSDINARMYHDVNRSDIVVDQEVSRALERSGVSLNDGREAYLDYERQQLLKDHEIDSYGMMHHDVSRSSAAKQDEEALRCRRDLSKDRNQDYLDDERLKLRSSGHFKVHANMRYPDHGRQEKVYHSNDENFLTRDEYGLRDEASEVIHERMVNDYKYNDVKQLGISYEKLDSRRFRDHEVAYDYRDKLGDYAVEERTSSEQFRYLADERSFGNDDHTSTPRHRISAKERLGGRVEDSRVHVKYRIQHQVKKPNLKGKSHNRNQKFSS